MSSTELDRFVERMGYLEKQGSPQNIADLEKKLKGVKQQLELVNRERNSLRILKEGWEETLVSVDKLLVEHDSPELIQTRFMMMQFIEDLGEEIALTRPDELHREKAHLKKEMAKKKLLARFAVMIGSSALRQDSRGD